MNKLDLSRCLMFRTDPSVDSAPPVQDYPDLF